VIRSIPIARSGYLVSPNNLAIPRGDKRRPKEKTSLKGGIAGSRERVFH
jgi:hypothetical protein